jgi:O-antigen ligase
MTGITAFTPAPPSLLWKRLPIFLLLLALVAGILASLMVSEEYVFLALAAPVGLAAVVVLLVHPKLVLIMVIIVIPLEEAHFWYLVIPGSMSISKILGLLLIGVLLFNILFRKEKFRLFDDPQDYAIGLFCAALLFSGVSSFYLDRVVDQVDRIFRLVALYFAVKNLVRDTKTVHILMLGLFLTSVYASAYAINQYLTVLGPWGDRIRAAGINDNPNNFAMASVIAFSLGMYLQAGKRLPLRLLYFIGIGIVLVGLVLSGSRGGLISFATVVLLMIWRHPKRVQLALATIILVVVSFPFWPSEMRGRYFAAFSASDFKSAEEESAESSSERRSGYYEFSLQLIIDHPIIGTGYRTFSHLFPRSAYARYDNPMTAHETYRVAHNVYLETIVGTGLVGLAALLMILFLSWRGLYMAASLSKEGSIPRAAARSLEYCLIAFCISSLFISSEQFKHLWYFAGMSSALLHYARTHAEYPLRSLR